MKLQTLLIAALLLAPLRCTPSAEAKPGGKPGGDSSGVVAGTYSGMYYESLLTFTVHADGHVSGYLEVIDNPYYPGSWGDSSEYFLFGTIDGSVGRKGRVSLDLAWYYDYPDDTGLPGDYYESIELRATTDANGAPTLMLNLGRGDRWHFPLS